MGYLIGEGVLNWPAEERRSDRYGLIYLIKTCGEDEKIVCPTAKINVKVVESLEGEEGSLVAEVIETRKSTHIGDLFRKIYVQTPKIGEKILLGE